jgi:CDP-glucose 4,6-dehydratase
LNWHPVTPLKMALDWIVEWYRAFREGGDLRTLTQTQIARYEALSRG